MPLLSASRFWSDSLHRNRRPEQELHRQEHSTQRIAGVLQSRPAPLLLGRDPQSSYRGHWTPHAVLETLPGLPPRVHADHTSWCRAGPESNFKLGRLIGGARSQVAPRGWESKCLGASWRRSRLRGWRYLQTRRGCSKEPRARALLWAPHPEAVARDLICL